MVFGVQETIFDDVDRSFRQLWSLEGHDGKITAFEQALYWIYQIEIRLDTRCEPLAADFCNTVCSNCGSESAQLGGFDQVSISKTERSFPFERKCYIRSIYDNVRGQIRKGSSSFPTSERFQMHQTCLKSVVESSTLAIYSQRPTYVSRDWEPLYDLFLLRNPNYIRLPSYQQDYLQS
jgi:hypothetical protein